MIINADDFGNSRNITDVIARCIEEGSLNSTSIMVTSQHLDYAISKLNALKEVRTSLHLNIAEGAPVTKDFNFK